MHKFPIPFWKFSNAMLHVNYYYPHRVKDFAKSFSENQVMAKSWLVEHLAMSPAASIKNKRITILGSWYGTVLVPLLRYYLKDISSITLIDYDKEAMKIAKWMHEDIITEVKDISFDIKKVEADIIINTSCEHMWQMKDIEMNGLCAFQSNDFTQEDAHVNCVFSLEEFREQTGITDIHYEGERPFDDYNDCKRFMLIGRQ